MRVTRGPTRRGNWLGGPELTDSKEPSQYIGAWKRGGSAYYGFHGGSIELKGTKKRDAQRNSQLEVWLSNEDVCALFNALLERKAEDEQKLRRTLREIDELLSELSKPSWLREGKSISANELLHVIEKKVRCALAPRFGRHRPIGPRRTQNARLPNGIRSGKGRVPQSGTEEDSPALQRWVGVNYELESLQGRHKKLRPPWCKWLPSAQIVTKVQLPYLYLRNLDNGGPGATLVTRGLRVSTLQIGRNGCSGAGDL